MSDRPVTDRTHPERPLADIVTARHQLEGAGFEVHRPFPTPELELLDPFLLLDEMGPVRYPPGSAKGAPDHPHRGFETVTYMLDGEFEHRDSVGNVGVIRAGDVQWMTAGAGIVHSEMPSTLIQTEGGRVHGFQLWVNLPADSKRTPPRYQSLRRSELATAEGEGWSAVVVAGALLGVEGVASTHTDIGYAHVRVQPGATIRVAVPADHNAGAYVFSGSAAAGSPPRSVGERQLATWRRQPGDLVLSVPADSSVAAEILLMTGRPLDEPVARYGPFVMNTRAELLEAFEDFQSGRMGAIAPLGAA